jgi:hypothetical protein
VGDLGFDALRDRLAAREKFLHVDCFHDGLCDDRMVEHELEKVEEIISEIERATT